MTHQKTGFLRPNAKILAPMSLHTLRTAPVHRTLFLGVVAVVSLIHLLIINSGWEASSAILPGQDDSAEHPIYRFNSRQIEPLKTTRSANKTTLAQPAGTGPRPAAHPPAAPARNGGQTSVGVIAVATGADVPVGNLPRAETAHPTSPEPAARSARPDVEPASQSGPAQHANTEPSGPAVQDKTGVASEGSLPYNPANYTYLVPPPARVNYEVQLTLKGIHQTAHAEMLWEHSGNTYAARLEVRHWLAGTRVQTSQGQLTELGLAPKRFSDKVRTEVAAHFERDREKIIFSANTPDAPLLPGMEDRLSVFLQIAALMAGQPQALPVGAHLLVPVVGPRAADLWRFTVEGNENLALPGGTVASVKLVRLPQREYDQKLEIWFAPSLAFLPVRIRLTEANGDVADQQWVSRQPP